MLKKLFQRGEYSVKGSKEDNQIYYWRKYQGCDNFVLDF